MTPGAVIAVAAVGLFAALVVYGLAGDFIRFIDDHDRRRHLAEVREREVALTALRDRYERPDDPLELLLALPARTPQHERRRPA